MEIPSYCNHKQFPVADSYLLHFIISKEIWFAPSCVNWTNHIVLATLSIPLAQIWIRVQDEAGARQSPQPFAGCATLGAGAGRRAEPQRSSASLGDKTLAIYSVPGTAGKKQKVEEH